MTGVHVAIECLRMLYFLVRGPERRSFELRLSPDGDGYELVVADEYGQQSVEKFPALDRAVARELELLSTCRALGWADPPTGRSRG